MLDGALGPRLDSGSAGTANRPGYIRNKVFEKARCAQLACVLFGPEAFTCGLQEKEPQRYVGNLGNSSALRIQESCVVVDIGGGPGIAALGRETRCIRRGIHSHKMAQDFPSTLLWKDGQCI